MIQELRNGFHKAIHLSTILFFGRGQSVTGCLSSFVTVDFIDADTRGTLNLARITPGHAPDFQYTHYL
jgi:hypothetical protein